MLDFIETIWNFYEKNRRSFAWRETRDPYAILVSELMLQQTQTHRVLPKYIGWLQQFPTLESLAQATLAEVLVAWSGLGYNRRAKFLWETAKAVVLRHAGRVPQNYAELTALPGIGEYTANALIAFAYNQPSVVLETNIRTALLHHFFEEQEKVSEKDFKVKLAELLESITKDKNTNNARDIRNWYYALMDYGNWLKSEGVDYFAKQQHYTKQSQFKGSDRFVRGWIIKHLTRTTSSLKISNITIVGYTKDRISKIASEMQAEGLITISRNTVKITE